MDRDNYYRSSRPGPNHGEPQGPERLPEVIYRRRRIAALVIILVVVAGIIVLARMFAGGSTNTAADSGAPSTTVVVSTVAAESSTSEAASSSAEASSTSATAESSAAPSESAKKTTCEIADLKMEATSNQPNYAEGDLPEFFMTISNPTATDCVIELGPKDLRFEVYNMATNQRVWSDVDCHASVLSGKDTIGPGESRSYSLTWGRAASQAETCEPRPAAPAGAYFLHTVMGTNASPAYAFNLV